MDSYNWIPIECQAPTIDAVADLRRRNWHFPPGSHPGKLPVEANEAAANTTLSTFRAFLAGRPGPRLRETFLSVAGERARVPFREDQLSYEFLED